MGDDIAARRMGVGSSGRQGLARSGVLVTDIATQSAINTLRNWSARRQANGRPVTPEIIRARIRELWPQTADAEMENIIVGVLS